MVSIITPAWGHEDITQNLVDGIATTTGVDFELIVVDNGNSFTPVQDYPWLRVIKPGSNLGFGGGNNLGAKHAKGNILLFINNDIDVLQPYWLSDLLKELQSDEIVGHELVVDNSYTLMQGKLHSYINGYLMLMHRKIFDDVGGFDTGFGKGWFEDVWFSVVAQNLGYKLREQKAEIYHQGSKTILDGRLRAEALMLRASYHFRDNVIKSWYPKDKLRIVFYTGGNYKFSDGSFEGKGVGGSESSLILLTRELAKLGHRVEVYGNPEVYGEQNGVIYHSIKEFRATDYCDVFVCFRNPIKYPEEINAVTKIFFSTDQYTIGNYDIDVFPKYDQVICISPYHLNYFKENYKEENGKSIYYNLGVNLPDYEEPVEKIPNKLLFCSVPHRGLQYLAKLFPLIKLQIPDAELFITSDYTLWGGDPDNQKFIDEFRDIKGVHFLGKISRKALVYHQKTAEIMAYPCVYEENFCISAAECIAAGCVPITSGIGSLKTTVGKDGVIIEGNPGEILFDDEFVRQVVTLLRDRPKLQSLSNQAKQSAFKRFNWKTIANTWETLLYSLRDRNMIDLLSRLQPFKTKNLTVLDLGCGKMESGISSQIPEIPLKDYVGVEIFPDAIEHSKKLPMVTAKREYVQEDILEYAEFNTDKKKDIVFLFDVMEHLEKKDGLKLLKNVEKIAQKRILIFMPLGEHTLEANDGIVAESGNPYQRHQSEWSVEEWQDLGYDVELLRGFHHGGSLDAAWIMKDTDYMATCPECEQEFNSAYYLNKHKISHSGGETAAAMASDIAETMPDVKIITAKIVDLSVNGVDWFGKTEIIVPYAQIVDVKRILTTAYGSEIIVSEELVENA